MPNLKLSDWANVAEIIASFAIIASLVYVGMEVSQNTRALQNDTYQNMMAMVNEGQYILATNEEFHHLYVTGENSPAELSEEEWSRFTHFNFNRMDNWEYLYLGKQDNAITPAVWSAYDTYFREIVCMPGHRRFFQENRTAYAPPFIAYLESEVLSNCPPK